MSLVKILEEIKTLQPLAAEDVEQGNLDTIVARRGRKNQALESLSRLRRAYTNELRSTAAFILVIGDKRQEFTELAVEKNRCYSADPEGYFAQLVDRVPSNLYLGKESMSNIFDVLGRHMEDVAHNLDIVGYPQLIFRQEYHQHVETREDFINLVKRAVTAQIGGEIVGIHAAATLTQTSIERGNIAKFTPIILPTGDEKFAVTVANDLGRISSRVFLVVAGEASEGFKSSRAISVPELTNENVKKALKKISDSLKKQS